MVKGLKSLKTLINQLIKYRIFRKLIKIFSKNFLEMKLCSCDYYNNFKKRTVFNK